MARKELSLPDEDRPKAKRLFEKEELAEPTETEDGEGAKRGFDRTRKSTFAQKGLKNGARKPAFTSRFADEDDGFGENERQKPDKSVRQYAMTLVSVHSYTERNLRQKLKMKGYGCDETDDAVEYLRSFGYINDLRLAQNAAEKLAAELKGRKKIYAYLASKGISGEVREQIDLSEIDFAENCKTLASRLASKGKSREQIIRALASAGFTQSEIIRAISER